MFRPEWTKKLAVEILKYDWPMPKDARKFNIKRMSTDELVKVFIAMARYESNFDPEREYKESFKDSSGKPVVSTGLFQLSVESLRGYGIETNQRLLKDPLKNIEYAVKVFHWWVVRDRVIARKRYCFFGTWRGAGRYWSVLRGERAYTKRALKAIREANK